MALSPEEREKIIEEETLKFETRKNLHAMGCSGHKAHRRTWLWFAAFFVLGYAVHGLCGGGACPWSGGGAIPAHCRFAGGMEGAQGMPYADEPQDLSAPAQAKP